MMRRWFGQPSPPEESGERTPSSTSSSAPLEADPTINLSAEVTPDQVDDLRRQVAFFHEAMSVLIGRVSDLQAEIAKGDDETMRQLADASSDDASRALSPAEQSESIADPQPHEGERRLEATFGPPGEEFRPGDWVGEYVSEVEPETEDLAPVGTDEEPPDFWDYPPYGSNEEHMNEEFERIDWLIRAQAVRWQRMVGRHKPDQLWGMLQVSEAEFRAYLNSDFNSPGTLPSELMERLLPFWTKARRIRARIRRRLKNTPPEVLRRLWFWRLHTTFHLSPLSHDVVLLCLLPEIEDRYRRLYGYLADDASLDRPTVEMVFQILYPEIVYPDRLGQESPEHWPDAIYETLHPESGLLRHHILAPGPEAQDTHPLGRRMLRLDDRISAYLLGQERPDGRIAPILAEAAGEPWWDDLHLPAHPEPPLLERLRQLSEWLPETLAGAGHGATVFLDGPYGSGRLLAAHVLSRAMKLSLLVVRLPLLLQESARYSFDYLVQLCCREARLRGAALYWAQCEALLEDEAGGPRWDYLVGQVEDSHCISFLASSVAWDPAGRFDRQPFVRLLFTMPGTQDRRRLWQQLLPPAHEWADLSKDRTWLAERLANGFQLTAGQMLNAIITAREFARSRNPQSPQLLVADIFDGCRRQSTRRLISFTRRIEPRPDLDVDDLILPQANKRQFVELLERVEYRGRLLSEFGFDRRGPLGRGLVAMFAGASGTGKTMAAGILAGKKGFDLYKIDLAAVVSKYVGETEKNLGKLFAEAEESSAILFFDEADALFGKRGEVREAHDRWANIEANYLLQRIEEYPGVVILATNLRQNLDDAFLRRIQLTVEFPFPEKDARARIWQGLFPAEVLRPSDELIADLAARFDIAGGSISNVVLGAAIRVLARDPNAMRLQITVRDLVLSVAREYQKLGRPITRGEFGLEYYAWAVDALLDPKVAVEEAA